MSATSTGPTASGGPCASRHLRVIIATLCVGLAPFPGSGIASQQVSAERAKDSSAAATVSPGPQEQRPMQDLLLQEIGALEDSLNAARRNMETGREQLSHIRRELRRLSQDLEEVKDQPGYERIRDRLLRLQSGLMESGIMGRIDIEFPPTGLETPETPGSESWRRYFPDVEGLGETRVRNEIFMVGRDVEVGVFEKVRGNVVVVGGGVTVSGSVGGDVIAVGHDIRVTHTGRVGGDAWTLGGRIVQEPGGMIEGDWIDTTSLVPSPVLFFRHNPVAWFMFAMTGVVFVLIACLVTGLVAPRNVDRIESQVRTRFGTSFLVGLVTEVLLPVVTILLLITIIGIPVALILVPVVLIGLLLLGFTGVAKSVGKGAERRGIRVGQSHLALITMGVLLLEALYILSRALGFAPGMLTPVALAGRLLGGLLLWVAWTAGLGAAIMTRFGTRTPGEAIEAKAPKPAPPPVGGEPVSEPAGS